MRCQRCIRALADGEPVYRLSLGHSHAWDHLFHSVGYVCVGCATERPGPGGYFPRSWHPPLPCGHCNRPVIHDITRKVPQHVVCGLKCRRAVYAGLAARRDAGLAPRRDAPPVRPCRMCATPFAPKRTNEVFCSNACRQRPYRQRA